MTVVENVAFPLKMAGRMTGEFNSRVKEFLDKVRFSGFADHCPHELSGGQKQRRLLNRLWAEIKLR